MTALKYGTGFGTQQTSMLAAQDAAPASASSSLFGSGAGGSALSSAGLGMMGAGAVSGALGSYFAASAQKDTLRAQAEISAMNARSAEVYAQSIMNQGQREEQNTRLKTAQLKSAQKVGFAANGVDLASGTAQNLMNSTDFMGEADAITIQQNTVRSAGNARMQKVGLENDALMRRTASNGINPLASGITSLVDSGSAVADKWYRYNKGV